MGKDEGSVCEPYQAIFYFQQMKMIREEWYTTVFKIVMLVVIFLVSIYLTQQSKSQVMMGICCFCAGMLLNIPVIIGCSIRKSSQCLNQIVFDDAGITINKNNLEQKTFLKTEVDTVEQKGEYLEMKTLEGKKYSYWMGTEYSMPRILRERLRDAIYRIHV